MKNNIRNEIKVNFSIIPNELILDNSISDRARFIFCLIASKPDTWKFYNNALAKELGYSVDTLRKYINELVLSGWIEKLKNRFDSNDYVLRATKTTVSEIPRYGDLPIPEKPDTYKEVLTVKSTLEKEVLIIHPLQKYISENLSNVSKLKTQLTEDNCKTLLEEHSKADIYEVLLNMENYNGLSKSYVSVYLTLCNWLKIREKKNAGQNGSNSTNQRSAQRGEFNKDKFNRLLDSNPEQNLLE